ncbi:MAG TPA: hypothetical protein VNK43_02495 [Gemmatimonadales bacterium]|nr:hypothetical protein [Gemmatimonadales bacterium]
MTSLPMVTPEAPLGIVIQNGGRLDKPALFWAYMWADDDDAEIEPGDHWHRHVPAQAA